MKLVISLLESELICLLLSRYFSVKGDGGKEERKKDRQVIAGQEKRKKSAEEEERGVK